MDTSQGSRKAFLLVFLVFVLGIALGSVGTYVITTRVHAARPQAARNPANRMASFSRDLNLNAEQRKQIEAIFNDTRARYAAIREQADPQYEKVRQESRERIRQVLTPEQGPKFEELLLRMDAERRKRESEQHGR
jgi:Spy/CpxP family protein refolding chaperone